MIKLLMCSKIVTNPPILKKKEKEPGSFSFLHLNYMLVVSFFYPLPGRLSPPDLPEDRGAGADLSTRWLGVDRIDLCTGCCLAG